jgi:hypothetical protein
MQDDSTPKTTAMEYFSTRVKKIEEDIAKLQNEEALLRNAFYYGSFSGEHKPARPASVAPETADARKRA